MAEKNRRSYRKLRLELEDLTEEGVLMLHKVDTADTAEQSDSCDLFSLRTMEEQSCRNSLFKCSAINWTPLGSILRELLRCRSQILRSFN